MAAIFVATLLRLKREGFVLVLEYDAGAEFTYRFVKALSWMYD